jgi:hypothetical protein
VIYIDPRQSILKTLMMRFPPTLTESNDGPEGPPFVSMEILPSSTLIEPPIQIVTLRDAVSIV